MSMNVFSDSGCVAHMFRFKRSSLHRIGMAFNTRLGMREACLRCLPLTFLYKTTPSNTMTVDYYCDLSYRIVSSAEFVRVNTHGTDSHFQSQ
eukprot:5143028-Amphidinium_carterae.1